MKNLFIITLTLIFIISCQKENADENLIDQENLNLELNIDGNQRITEKLNCQTIIGDACLVNNPDFPISQITEYEHYLGSVFVPHNLPYRPNILETTVRNMYPHTYEGTVIEYINVYVSLKTEPFNLVDDQVLLTANQANLVLNDVQCTIAQFLPNGNNSRPKIELQYFDGSILLCNGNSTPFIEYSFKIYQ